MTLHAYVVGSPYIAGRTSYKEGVDYNYRSGAHELRLYFPKPSAREIEEIRRGPCEFAVLAIDDVIAFLYRFGAAVPWSDQPFTIWLVPETERTVPAPAEIAEPHDMLSIILVDAATGLIRALRTVSFSPAFSAALRLAIRDQAALPWPGDAGYNAQVQQLYARYPTSQAMVAAAQSRTMGGR